MLNKHAFNLPKSAIWRPHTSQFCLKASSKFQVYWVSRVFLDLWVMPKSSTLTQHYVCSSVEKWDRGEKKTLLAWCYSLSWCQLHWNRRRLQTSKRKSHISFFYFFPSCCWIRDFLDSTLAPPLFHQYCHTLARLMMTSPVGCTLFSFNVDEWCFDVQNSRSCKNRSVPNCRRLYKNSRC